MKWPGFAVLILPFSSLLFVSCVTPKPKADAQPRFREAAAASVVLQYCAQRINITQPECRESGFLIEYSLATVGPALQRLNVRRDMAVVVLRWNYERENVNQLVADWKDLLRRHGFKRVVCLQAGIPKQVQGLVILDDTQPSVTTPPRTASL